MAKRPKKAAKKTPAKSGANQDGNPEADALVDALELDWDDLLPEVTPVLEAEAAAGAAQYLLSAGFTQAKDPAIWKTVSEQARQQARARGAELVGKRLLADGTVVDNPAAAWSIQEATRERLRELVSQAINEGWTANQTQQAILEDDSFSPKRALTIARTESAYARSRGTQAAAKGTGMKYKDWIGHEGMCPICEANVEEGRIPIEELFPSEDECAPAHPNCICSNGYYESKDGE